MNRMKFNQNSLFTSSLAQSTMATFDQGLAEYGAWATSDPPLIFSRPASSYVISTLQRHTTAGNVKEKFLAAVSDDEDLEDSLDDSGDERNLMIADMQEAKLTEGPEAVTQNIMRPELIFNGLMTRRQSKYFKDASDNYAVYSVRNGTSKSSKNRTCEYCHVVKATPAALVRHLRKHTGERPFVCNIKHCGKSYKAKRSLNLHQSTYHKDPVKMLTPTSLLAVQIAASAPLPSSPAPAVSEMTKSLLRETLESSRKARDVHTGHLTSDPSQIFNMSSFSRLPEKFLEKFSTPNLVNLLTSDLTKGHLPAEVSYLVRQEKMEDERERKSTTTDEEQAEDLSMTTARKSGKSFTAPTSLERNYKCDFCTKTFRHEISCINHTRTDHGIVLNPQHGLPLTVAEARTSSHQVFTSAGGQLQQEVTVELPYITTSARPGPESSGAPVERLKLDVPSAGNDGGLLDESNSLPYHITSRMIQEINSEMKHETTDKTVVADDGGNRRTRITVEKETVLVSRLDGINNISGRRATVFRCHLCHKVFSSLVRYSSHLPSHYETEVQTYDCRFCEASFRSQLQILKHLQCHREKFSGSSANSLLMDDLNKKHKDHQDSPSSNGPFNPSEVSLTEPGERANGGYSCTKCQKRFSREYLLQRHMRVHQTISFCHLCNFSFMNEVDLLEHLRVSHNNMQYTNLLKSLHATVPTTATVSDSNNNKAARSHLLPLVDMKAFDLRRGEQVEVRMTSDATARNDHPAIDERLLLFMAAARDQKTNSKILQSQQKDMEPKRPPAATLADLRKLAKVASEVRKSVKGKPDEEEARREARRENEKKRLVEQEKLKLKLAQEGMGDVMVVLPDAPPESDRPTDLSMKSQLGFMARRPQGDSQAETMGWPQTSAETKLSPNSSQGASAGTKRLSDHGTSAPPTKNRRKALKPQRIQHMESNQVNNQSPITLSDGQKEDNNNNHTGLYKRSNSSGLGDLSSRESSAFSQVSAAKSGSPDPSLKQTSLVVDSQGTTMKSCIDTLNGPIDLSTDTKNGLQPAWIVQLPIISSPLSESLGKQVPVHQLTLRRSVSLDPDSENSLSQELTSAADLSKSSRDPCQSQLRSSPMDLDHLIGFPRVAWKSGQPLDTLEAVSNRFQSNGKGSGSSQRSKSQASSPSPAPSPTNSDTASSEGRKTSTTTSLSRTHSSTRATSLSRTHSRLSVVNEPLDRNSLCKPKVLNDGRSVYSCAICHKNFQSLSDINRHMDFHEDIRPYKCKYCDYFARTNSQLKVHKLRHEGVREFCCRVCNYKGVTQSDLNRHMKSQVHLLRSNHVCPQCGEGFVTPKTLRDHSLSCTGVSDKSLDTVLASEDELPDDDSDNVEGEESMSSEVRLESTSNEVKLVSTSNDVKLEAM